MLTLSIKARLLVVLGLCCLSRAFSSSSSKPFTVLPKSSTGQHAAAFSTAQRHPHSLSLRKRVTPLLSLRGGEQEEGASLNEDPTPTTSLTGKMSVLAPVASILQSLGSAYSTQLTNRPILTKSVTATFIFGLSDWTAQKIEGSDEEEAKMNWTRIISASLVGLLYFGPAAHGWYETIFRILPKQSLISTLQKAALGQLLFGPSFTCIFFATSLMQSGEFTLGSWFKKIKSDFLGAWVAGLGFWPLVDLFSYSVLPSRWIPLFVNVCSYVWTIYLSLVANKRASSDAEPSTS